MKKVLLILILSFSLVGCNKKTLKESILENDIIDSNVIWTNGWQESDSSGLYSNDTNNGTTYYFRGNPKNNYLKFNDLDFRIVRINEDGSIRLILSNSIDNKTYEFNNSYKDYNYIYYSNSSIKSIIDDWYVNTITSKEKVVVSDFCEQAKVIWNNDYEIKNVSAATRENYTPTFNCENDGNGKGNLKLSVGLITYDEIFYAGGSYIENNKFNYYLKNKQTYWTMSPAGFYENRVADVWHVYKNGFLDYDYVNDDIYIRPVINIKGDVIVKGNGTKDNPYVVK